MMATDGITSFSTKPIEIISVLALVSFLVVIAGLIAITVQMINNGIVSPWMMVFTSVWTIGAFQLVAIRIIGDYIGKIFKETKTRPRYTIAENILDQDE